MTGVVVTVRIDDREPRRLFNRLALRMADTAPVMRAIGVGIREVTHTHFEAGTDPDGRAWTPLDPGYAAGKRGPGILRESGMRGGLMGSLAVRATATSVELGTNKVYGAVHQFGAVIRPKAAGKLVFRMGGRLVMADSVTIPARRYLGIGADHRAAILDVLRSLLAPATRAR